MGGGSLLTAAPRMTTSRCHQSYTILPIRTQTPAGFLSMDTLVQSPGRGRFPNRVSDTLEGGLTFLKALSAKLLFSKTEWPLTFHKRENRGEPSDLSQPRTSAPPASYYSSWEHSPTPFSPSPHAWEPGLGSLNVCSSNFQRI